MKKVSSSQSGFTIIELMIATLVFSMVLLLCAMAIIHVGRMYFKGITMSRTQGVARAITEDITQAVQFGIGSYVTGSANISGVPMQALCVGAVRYSYVMYRRSSDDIKHSFWKDRLGAGDTCTPQNLTLDQPSAGGEELMGDHMRIAAFDFSAPPSGGNIYSLALTVSYGAADLFTNSTNQAAPDYLSTCRVDTGSQFCATSILNTSMAKRL